MPPLSTYWLARRTAAPVPIPATGSWDKGLRTLLQEQYLSRTWQIAWELPRWTCKKRQPIKKVPPLGIHTLLDFFPPLLYPFPIQYFAYWHTTLPERNIRRQLRKLLTLSVRLCFVPFHYLFTISLLLLPSFFPSHPLLACHLSLNQHQPRFVLDA